MADPAPASTTSRIAIKFGAGPSPSSKLANGLKKSGSFQPSSSLGKRSRPHALDQDSGSDGEADNHGKHETVTSFGENGAENDHRQRDAKAQRRETTPLVIACQANRDWKAETRAQQGGELLPHEREKHFKVQDQETEPADLDKQIKWGLTVNKKTDIHEQSTTTDQKPFIIEASPNGQDGTVVNETQEPQDANQDAIDALMGKERKKKKLVITEDDALKRDYDEVGEVSTLEDYDKIPDGEFGLAMLRGMGYDGKSHGTKPKEVRRRTALLGLGAKEDEEIKKAELSKKHGYRERRPRLDEYRREKEQERQKREDKYSNSFKSERERDRAGQTHHRRIDDRDRDRDRDRHHRDRERDDHRRYTRR